MSWLWWWWRLSILEPEWNSHHIVDAMGAGLGDVGWMLREHMRPIGNRDHRGQVSKGRYQTALRWQRDLDMHGAEIESLILFH